MTLVTPDTIEGVYVFLCTTLPFRRWKMPDPDSLEFYVLTTRERRGHWRAYVNPNGIIGELAISAALVKTTHELVSVTAHEMVHIRQEACGYRDHHGPHFKRLSKLVCRRHGFDYAAFV